VQRGFADDTIPPFAACTIRLKAKPDRNVTDRCDKDISPCKKQAQDYVFIDTDTIF